ncbi:PREDICTED: uncharacterized protein LOC105558140 isoform X2 [Vollenhovia emeryi]|uniref:uncharacterized protein LOC105558140 isoform X2 n=1 Tax=Vollenhovia emeryi TaxID=411798 RepID=UPI0005F54EBB|nr:PREDICTED: uncharacterized protein LOC105558140 isoform X2 [Vollenhovia emeryi]
MANLSGNSWKEIRHKRVLTFTSDWQNCPVNQYYIINRILLLCIGLWPYQKSSFRRIIITFTTIMIASGIIFQLTIFITTEYNLDMLLRVLTYSIPWLSYMFKYNVYCLNIRRIRYLMERIQHDWNQLNDMQEIEIIKEYAAFARLITLITTLFFYVSIFSFIVAQFLFNILLDITSSKNESRLRQFPVLIECFIDQQKYYFPILIQIYIIVVCGLTTVVATEMLNMSFILHACGLFDVASCRIEQALHENTVQNISSPTERSLIICRGIIHGFNMYQRANEFVEMMKVLYTRAYSLLLPIGVLSLSINLYRFSQLITTEDYYETIISFVFISGHFWYMLFGNYIGQQVIDHSSDVFYKTYNGQWYVASLKAQKLLLLVMQRSMRHCTIVIAGLFISSLEGFATLASSSISYFAVIVSLST